MNHMSDMYIEKCLSKGSDRHAVEDVQVDESEGCNSSFEHRDSAEGDIIDGHRLILWEISSQRPDTLHVCNIDLEEGVRQADIIFKFPSALYPQAVLLSKPSLSVCVFSAKGYAHCLQFTQSPNWSSQYRHASVSLKGVLTHLDSISCLSHSSDYIFLAGTSGSVVGLLSEKLSNGSLEGIITFQDARSRLSSLFVRAPSQSPVTDVSVVQSARSEQLFVIHANNKLQIWDVSTRRKISSIDLVPESVVSQQLTAKKICISEGDQGRYLVVLFEPSNPFEQASECKIGVFKILEAPNGSLSLDNINQGLLNVTGPCEDLEVSQDNELGLVIKVLIRGVESYINVLLEDGEEGPIICLEDSSKQDPNDIIIQLLLWNAFEKEYDGDIDKQELLYNAFARVLAPDRLCYSALERVLNDLGKVVSTEDLMQQSLPENLHFLVHAILDAESTSSPYHQALFVMQNYRQAWQAFNPGLCVLKSAKTGETYLVRLGLGISILKPAVYSEAINYGFVSHETGIEEALQDPNMLSEAVSGIRKIFGSQILQSSAFLVWKGAEFSSSIAPSLLSSLNLRGDERTNQRGTEEKQIKDWTRQRRIELVKIGQNLGNVRDLPQDLEKCLEELTGKTKQQNEQQIGFSPLDFPGWRCLARANSETLASLLLLIQYLNIYQSIGAYKIDIKDMEIIQSEIIPLIEAALKINLVLEWLLVTVRESLDQPLSSLAKMENGGFSGQISPNSDFHGAAFDSRNQLLASLLETSQYIGKTKVNLKSLSDYTIDQSLPSHLQIQVIGVACVLFQNAEYTELSEILTIMDSEEKSPALLLFKGLAILGQNREILSQYSRTKEAISYLEEASSVFRPNQTEDGLRDRSILKSVFERLLSTSGEEMFGAVPEVDEFTCHTSVVRLCERVNSFQAASHFARSSAKLAQSLRENASEELKPQILQEEGALWSKVFGYYLDSKHFEEAYTALVANPVGENTLNDLHSLIYSLCTEKKLKILFSLPFGSVIVIQEHGRISRKSMQQAIIEILHKYAENMDLQTDPQPYMVLSSFLGSKEQWREAAQTHLLHARRLQEENPASNSIASALSSAANALSFVPTHQQWLEDKELKFGQSLNAPFAIKKDEGVPNEPSGNAGPSGSRCISLKQLQGEAQSAQILLQYYPTKAYTNPQDVVGHLQHGGQFEAAINLAEVALAGENQPKSIKESLFRLAYGCAQNQYKAELSRQSLQKGWASLQRLTETHAKGGQSFSILSGIAEAILQVDSHFALPQWLLEKFLDVDFGRGMIGGPGNQIALTKIYMDYNRVHDAGIIVKDALNNWLFKISDLERQRVLGTWFPHLLISTLLKIMEKSHDASTRRLGEDISDLLTQFLNLAKEQTLLLESYGQDQQRSFLTNGSKFGWQPGQPVTHRTSHLSLTT